MGIVIGAATQASLGGACVISANWNMSQNSQKLYCLGSWDPHLTIDKPTQTLSMTVYSPGPTYNTLPSTGCVNANTQQASVSPASCGGGSIGGVSGDFYVTSYSFTKDDPQLPGQESWSMMKYVGDILPSYNLRGITEGQATGETAGMTFESSSAGGSSGSVSANAFGKADEMIVGVVSSVGGGSSTAGETGTGSASIPYTPLYL